jgi:Fuc2NAc and GlcNAc transferase
LTLAGTLTLRSFLALAGGGAAVALVGWLDDQRNLPARVRFAAHVVAAAWALYWLDGMPALHAGGHVLQLGAAGYVFGALGIVWTLNLFNFMDGIDGIAGSEAVFIGLGGAVLGIFGGLSTGTIGSSIVLAAASGGFLLWNWPPARIFMGDVGSGYLGYVIAVLAIMAGNEHPPAIYAWLLLGALFFVDATVTLARRIARGESPAVAHRSHAYQCLSRKWCSHLNVTLLFLALNVTWLLPWAYVAWSRPTLTLPILACALTPLVLLALVAGAGRRETNNRS